MPMNEYMIFWTIPMFRKIYVYLMRFQVVGNILILLVQTNIINAKVIVCLYVTITRLNR